MSVIIYYYTDWCPHCKKFTPIYQEVKNQFKDTEGLYFLEINCEHKESTYMYETGTYLVKKGSEFVEEKYIDFSCIKEYPTLNLVKNNKVIELEKYTKEDFIEFINNRNLNIR